MDNLSAEVTAGLALLAGLQDEASFKALVDLSVDVTSKPDDKFSKSVEAKQALAAISSFMFEAAKLNADPSVLGGILEENKMTGARQEYVLNKYKTAKPSLRQQLANTSFHPPKLVDVDWRLDYFLKANSVEKINMPIYRIVLQTRAQDGSPQDMEVACTMDQLQDLVSKLKDATKQLERSAGRA